MIEFDMNRFLTKNDMGYYYSEKELNIFLSSAGWYFKRE
jgi:hypothetical protein